MEDYKREPKTGKFYFWASIGLIILSFPLFCSNLFEEYYPRYDSGGFIVVAKSLAEGHGYTEISNPLEPRFIHYPPAVPVALAGIIKIFGMKYPPMRLFIILLASGSLLILWRRFRWFFSERDMPVVLLMSSVSLLMLYSGRVQADVPYFFVSLVGLSAIHTEFNKSSTNSVSQLKVFFLLVLASLMKAQAIVLGLTAIVWVLIKRGMNRRTRILLLVASIAGTGSFIGYMAYQQPDYLKPSQSKILLKNGQNFYGPDVELFSMEFVERFSRNIANGVTRYVPSALIPADPTMEYQVRFGFLNPALMIMGAFMLMGYVSRIIYRPGLMELYVVIYGALHFVSPWVEDGRFFVPLVPFLAGYFLWGMEFVASGIGRLVGKIIRKPDPSGQDEGETAKSPGYRRFALAMSGFIVLFNVYILFVADLKNPWGARPNLYYNMAILAKVSSNPDDVVILHDHYGGYLVSGRKTFSYSPGEQHSPPGYNLYDYLDKGGRVDWLIVKRVRSDLKLAIEPLQMRGYSIGAGNVKGSAIIFKVDR